MKNIGLKQYFTKKKNTQQIKESKPELVNQILIKRESPFIAEPRSKTLQDFKQKQERKQQLKNPNSKQKQSPAKIYSPKSFSRSHNIANLTQTKLQYYFKPSPRNQVKIENNFQQIQKQHKKQPLISINNSQNNHRQIIQTKQEFIEQIIKSPQIVNAKDQQNKVQFEVNWNYISKNLNNQGKLSNNVNKRDRLSSVQVGFVYRKTQNFGKSNSKIRNMPQIAINLPEQNKSILLKYKQILQKKPEILKNLYESYI